MDDTPYGGGAGMLLSCQPYLDALAAVEKKENSKTIIMSPQGKTFNQNLAKEYAKKDQLIIICGHYEGFDERIRDYVDVQLSLGDFILELYSVPSAPEDFYEKYGLTSESTVYELLKTRSKNFTIGLMEEQRMLNAVIPFWETENKKIKRLTLLPTTIIRHGKDTEIGLPRKSDDTAFMDDFARLSEPFGVKIKPSGRGLYTCEW